MRLAFISDIHLGHKEITTAELIAQLNESFTNSTIFNKINLAVLGGDVFDRLLKTNSDEYGLIITWASRLLDLCVVHNVSLRVLEGTPSHDDKQPKIFLDLANSLITKGLEIDFKYIDELHVEQNTRFGLNWLYIPDEWQNDCAKTFEQVKQKLTDLSIEKVDYAFMHGQFDYQLPDVVKPHLTHKYNDYENVIKKACFIGHIHTYSQNGYINAPGSFGRLSQGQPEKKGYLLCNDTPIGCDITFVVNENANVFISFKCDSADINEALSFISAKLKKVKAGARVKIIVDKTSVLLKNEKTLASYFTQYVLKVDTKEDKKQTQKAIELSTIESTAIIINANTISNLLHSRIAKRINDPVRVQRVMNALASCI